MLLTLLADDPDKAARPRQTRAEMVSRVDCTVDLLNGLVLGIVDQVGVPWLVIGDRIRGRRFSIAPGRVMMAAGRMTTAK